MIALFAFTIVVAIICATDDAKEIADGDTIFHRWQWVVRGALVLACAGICAGALGIDLWRIAFSSVASAFLFSTVFRFTLNRVRRLRWWYLGPELDARRKDASWYDGKFHWLAWAFGGFRKGYMGRDLTGFDCYVRTYPSKLPGILAYCFELIAFAALAWTATRFA